MSRIKIKKLIFDTSKRTTDTGPVYYHFIQWYVTPPNRRFIQSEYDFALHYHIDSKVIKEWKKQPSFKYCRDNIINKNKKI